MGYSMDAPLSSNRSPEAAARILVGAIRSHPQPSFSTRSLPLCPAQPLVKLSRYNTENASGDEEQQLSYRIPWHSAAARIPAELSACSSLRLFSPVCTSFKTTIDCESRDTVKCIFGARSSVHHLRSSTIHLPGCIYAHGLMLENAFVDFATLSSYCHQLL